jgi:tRNA U34 5-carboxymethylaminomethyl modifying enzyme MnmG/GidA
LFHVKQRRFHRSAPFGACPPPQVSYLDLAPFDEHRPAHRRCIDEVEIEIKYEGYIKRQLAR